MRQKANDKKIQLKNTINKNTINKKTTINKNWSYWATVQWFL